MKFLILIILLTFFLFSCETKRKDISDVLASVDGKTLTLNKIQKLNPGLPLDKESLPLMVSSWVTNTVLLKKGIEQKLDKEVFVFEEKSTGLFNFSPNQVLSTLAARNRILDNSSDDLSDIILNRLMIYFASLENDSKE